MSDTVGRAVIKMQTRVERPVPANSWSSGGERTRGKTGERVGGEKVTVVNSGPICVSGRQFPLPGTRFCAHANYQTMKRRQCTHTQERKRYPPHNGGQLLFKKSSPQSSLRSGCVVPKPKKKKKTLTRVYEFILYYMRTTRNEVWSS